MGKRENWVFIFAAVGALAGLVKILEYFGITFTTPPATEGAGQVPLTHPPYTGLIWAIGLIVFSLALSAYGLYLSNRKRSDALASVTKERDQLRLETDRINQHRVDLMGSQIADLKNKSTQTNVEKPLSKVEAAVLNRLWVEWAAMGDTYQRLDYDNRNNDSTRLPFHNASLPAFGEPWNFVHVRLRSMMELFSCVRGWTEDVLMAFEWKGRFTIPEKQENTVMVDLLTAIRELQNSLKNEIDTLKRQGR